MATSFHPVFQHPVNRQISVWRYMDFTKFVSMLENNGLFLSQADCLGDPFEGSYSHGSEIQYPPDSGITLEIVNMLRDKHKWGRDWIFINCWHMNEYESAAMWKLYSQTNEAIAIRTTFEKLDNVLDETCHLGTVNYIDYEQYSMRPDNIYYPYVHKRLSFAHECEVRVFHDRCAVNGEVININKPIIGGIWKQVNLLDLIDCIYVAPSSPFWFKELVEQIVTRYSLKKQVLQSELDREPLF